MCFYVAPFGDYLLFDVLVCNKTKESDFGCNLNLPRHYWRVLGHSNIILDYA